MLDITNIPLDDQATWDMICEGRVKGCFQIESPLGRTWCKKVKPRNIRELSDLISLVRPGCISGDTLISVQYNPPKHSKKSNRFTKIRLEDLYKNRDRISEIISLDEQDLKFKTNKILDVIYTGEKECFKIKIRKYSMGKRNSSRSTDWYNIECTKDHKILTVRGYIELQFLQPGDRIAVVKRIKSDKRIKDIVSHRHSSSVKINNQKSMKYFHEICYKHYEEKCVICGWNNTTLDAHHINGGREVDNHPNNLCYLCPNHHREHEHGLISITDILSCRDKYKLPLSDSIEWVTYLGKESVGIKSVYDISMEAPNHNFVAGNFVVHNCLKFIYDGKSMAQHYADRKSGIDEAIPIHPSLREILSDTYQVLLYQEQIIQISREIAGFSESEADLLRKGVGKKDAELLNSLEVSFIDGCLKVGKVNRDEAVLIFSNIKKSARYLFNLSHGVSYAYLAYWSAYLKVKRQERYYLNWLQEAKEKIDPSKEMRELIASAKNDGIKVRGPCLELMNENFAAKDRTIYFGFCNVKNVGKIEYQKIKDRLSGVQLPWEELMVQHLLDFNKRTIDNLVYVGTFNTDKPRLRMVHELSCLRELSKTELTWLRSNYISGTSLVQNLERLSIPKNQGGGVSNKNRSALVKDIIVRLQNPGRDLNDNAATLSKIEVSLLGCEISFSELDSCRDASFANCTCVQYLKKQHPREVVFAATIKAYREIETKNEELMCFLTIEDKTAELESIIVFPNVYSECSGIIYDGSTVLISGQRSSKGDDGFIVESIEQI